mgnify:FL=1
MEKWLKKSGNVWYNRFIKADNLPDNRNMYMLVDNSVPFR